MSRGNIPPKVPFKPRPIPSNSDHKALNGGTFGGSVGWRTSEVRVPFNLRLPLQRAERLEPCQQSGCRDPAALFGLSGD